MSNVSRLKSKIYYHEVEDLGFHRIDYTDAVVFRKTGHHPFHMSKELPGRLVIYWMSEERNCELLRLDKKQNILGKVIIKDLELLCAILHFYGFGEDVKNLREKNKHP
jgi:hypothetical protein